MIYLDNAATTPVLDEVLTEMIPYFKDDFLNPSSSYAMEEKRAIMHAKNSIARLINAKPSEIYFTSGGSESDNWSIKSTALSLMGKGRHIITSKIEHHAVLNTCAFLEKHGFDVTYLDVDETGMVEPESVRNAIQKDTILISIMSANNEIGTIEPIQKIGEIAREYGILFHTDAVQAFGHIPLDVNAMRIDMLSASGHKIHGPKGVGILYVRDGIPTMESLIHGGMQEHGHRAGTYNMPGIVGMGKAAEIADKNLSYNIKHMSSLRDAFINDVLASDLSARLNGSKTDRLPNNINLSFPYVEGECILNALYQKGIYISSGSACMSGSLEPSHVLLACGIPYDKAHGSIRISLSELTTMDELHIVEEILFPLVQKMQKHSPLNK